MIISPSILSANFGNLSEDINMLNNSKAEWIHIDVMDGVFVPNISFGFPIMESVKKTAKKPLDVHIMIVEPSKYITEFKRCGADILTFHYEACNHINRTISEIKKNGMKAGISLNPHTPISLLESIIKDVDMVLIMSVNPGFGGQKFIENTYDKVKELKNLIAKKSSSALIQVDGGVNYEIAVNLAKEGVDSIVAGSYIFNAESPLKTIELLKSI